MQKHALYDNVTDTDGRTRRIPCQCQPLAESKTNQLRAHGQQNHEHALLLRPPPRCWFPRPKTTSLHPHLRCCSTNLSYQKSGEGGPEVRVNSPALNVCARACACACACACHTPPPPNPPPNHPIRLRRGGGPLALLLPPLLLLLFMVRLASRLATPLLSTSDSSIGKFGDIYNFFYATGGLKGSASFDELR